MPEERILEVQAQEDFVEKLAAAHLAQALAELSWNSLDAEATKVSIEADRGPIGLMSVRIRDNGHGMPYSEAENLFKNIGGSWKRSVRRSKNDKRILHGEEGKGRFRALAVGRVAEWLVTARESSGRLIRYRITMIKDSAKTFRLSEPEPADVATETGVEVTISEPYKQWEIEAPGLIQQLNEIHALYLTDYPDASVTVSGVALDPRKLIETRKSYQLPPITGGDGQHLSVALEVVEWKASTERTLYFCTEDGFPLHLTAPGIHAPGF